MKTKFIVSCFVWTLVLLLLSAPAAAIPVVIPDVPAYGYNVDPAPDGDPEIMGCGPTTGVMILDTYDNRGAAGLIVNPLTDARLLHNAYMNTDPAGFGPASDFHFGMEQFALDRGYILDAVVHVEPTTYNPADWAAYTVGPDLALDATFWNTATWDIIDNLFLDFLASEIDAGRPVSVTVDSDGIDGTDHWMVGVGYDRDAGLWAGYDTWDALLHWYDIESAFIAGNPMGIGFVRTFQLEQAIPPIPEPATMLLLGAGMIGLAGLGRRRLIGKG